MILVVAGGIWLWKNMALDGKSEKRTKTEMSIPSQYGFVSDPMTNNNQVVAETHIPVTSDYQKRASESLLANKYNQNI